MLTIMTTTKTHAPSMGETGEGKPPIGTRSTTPRPTSANACRNGPYARGLYPLPWSVYQSEARKAASLSSHSSRDLWHYRAVDHDPTTGPNPLMRTTRKPLDRRRAALGVDLFQTRRSFTMTLVLYPAASTTRFRCRTARPETLPGQPSKAWCRLIHARYHRTPCYKKSIPMRGTAPRLPYLGSP